MKGRAMAAVGRRRAGGSSSAQSMGIVMGGVALAALLVGGAKNKGPKIHQLNFGGAPPEEEEEEAGEFATLDAISADVTRQAEHDPSMYFYADDEPRADSPPAPGAPLQLEDGAARDLEGAIFETTAEPARVES